MKIRVILRDYRCFSREQPVVIDIQPGFTAYVGANNAGKSTILKSFYELRPLYEYLQNPIGQWGENFERHQSVNFLRPVSDPREIENNRPDPQLSVEVEVLDIPASTEELTYAHKAIVSKTPNGWILDVFEPSISTPVGQKHGRQLSTPDNRGRYAMHGGPRLDIGQLQKAATILSNVLYIGAFRNAINEGAANYFDLRVGTSFIDLWHHWKTGGSKEQNRAMVEVTRKIAKLLGASSLEINASPELKTLQIRLDDEPYKLSELGSGIAELIVVLANAVVVRPSIIAINEPEAHLHPKLQSEFLTTLGSFATSSVLFTTHVLGLARSIADYSYSVQHGPRGSIVRELNKTSNYAEFLGSLGLSALLDVGFDRILMVEGVTEVRVYQQLLRTYELDNRVVIIPLGGSSLINGKVAHELSEVKRLCPKVFAVVDSERTSNGAALLKDRQEFLSTCAKLDITAIATERRAIENYFTTRAIQSSVGKNFVELGPFEKPNPVPWGKAMNWMVARELTKEELDNTDLGAFLGKMRTV